jgi:hypothetical protein
VQQYATRARVRLSRSMVWWAGAAGCSLASKALALVMILSSGPDPTPLRMGAVALSLPLDVLVGGMLTVWFQRRQSQTPH